MTLRRRMMLYVGGTAVGAAILCVGIIAGLRAQREDYGTALQANRQLRRAYEAGVHVAAAKRWLGAQPRRADLALAEVKRAALVLDHAAPTIGDLADDREANTPVSDWLTGSAASVTRVRESLRRAAVELAGTGDGRRFGAAAADAAPLDAALAGLAELSSETRTTIAARQRSADAKHHAILMAALCLCVFVGCGAVYGGARIYRAVMTPMDRLSNAVRRIAGGHRDERVPTDGDLEFVTLARDFNSMASEVGRLCSDLEQRVADKSRELIRSERLASVGFLAAGVAHEINNPLGIIAGYGERSLRQLRRGLDAATAARVEQAIGVMCDEAFRCRGITDRLLSLARPGEERRGLVSVGGIAREVISNVAALPCAAGRSITLETACDGDRGGGNESEPCIIASAPRITQVVLNLVVNALEAVAPGEGRVNVAVRRAGSQVELHVGDNGRGMPPEVLDRIFEPFYTERADQGPGTGLGLCISQAIVREHGGTILARSAGRGQGSCFVVRLPAAREGACLAG